MPKKLNSSTRTEEDLLSMFKKASSVFFEKERENILAGTAERNLSGRLAVYLENLLSEFGLIGYYSDPEYNRKQGGQIKTILDNELNVIIICPDVVVHSRGNNIEQDNLIVIEMKKSFRPQYEKDSDRKRLRAMTKDSYDDVWSYDGKTHPKHVCGYGLGVYMEINTEQRQCLLEYYKKGLKAFEEMVEF